MIAEPRLKARTGYASVRRYVNASPEVHERHGCYAEVER